MKIYSVHGRFQPLHLGHLNNYILPVKDMCDLLIVGITNPDPHLTFEDKTNPSRASPKNNPLSYYERYTIILDTLTDCGIAQDQFRIVPFPINFPQLIHGYVPKNSTHYLTIFDEWGERKIKLLQQNGFETSVLFRKPISEKKISSTDVRNSIIKQSKWEHLVPSACRRNLSELNIFERLIKFEE